MSQMLEPDLAWTGAAFEPGIRIADRRGRPDRGPRRAGPLSLDPVAGRGADPASGHRSPPGIRRHPFARLPARTARSGERPSRRAPAVSGPGARRCTRWSIRSIGPRCAASLRARSRRCGTPASRPWASSTTSTTSARVISRSTMPSSRRRPMPGSGWSCCTASTRRARRAGRSRAANAGSRRRRWTSSGGRWTGLARGWTRLRRRWASRRTAFAPRAPRQIREIHREASRRGLPIHLHVEEQRRESRRVARRLWPDADGGDSRRGRGRAVHRGALHAHRRGGHGALPGAGGTVCLCPLTEGNLGDGIPQLMQVARHGRPPGHRHRQQQPARRCWRRCGGWSTANGCAASCGARCPMREVMSRPPCSPARRPAAPTRWAYPPAGSPRGSGRISSRSISARRRWRRCRPERLLAAVVFGAGNEAIAGTYVGGRWRASARSP